MTYVIQITTGVDKDGKCDFRAERVDHHGEAVGAAAKNDHAALPLAGGGSWVEQEHCQYIAWQDGGKARQYYPKIRREEAALAETEHLLSRVYKGSVGMMMSTLVRKRDLTKEEIQELYDILDGLEGRKE